MVPAGDPTEDTINSLGTLLRDGALVIEGGNSNWRDSVRRGEALGDLGVGYLDAGTSRGVWGPTEGYCSLVGGARDAVALSQPLFADRKTVQSGQRCSVRVALGGRCCSQNKYKHRISS